MTSLWNDTGTQRVGGKVPNIREERHKVGTKTDNWRMSQVIDRHRFDNGLDR